MNELAWKRRKEVGGTLIPFKYFCTLFIYYIHGTHIYMYVCVCIYIYIKQPAKQNKYGYLPDTVVCISLLKIISVTNYVLLSVDTKII